LEAADKAGVVRRLNELGYSIARTELRLPWLAGGLTRKDLQIFTRGLATLMGSRMPLDRSLQLRIDLGAKGRVRSLLADLLERIQRGSTLADAVASHADVFPGRRRHWSSC